MRYKLARLSAALAARTFSIRDNETILVRECHVEYIYKYLNEVYDSKAFGYNEFSKAVFSADKLVSKTDIKNRLENKTTHPKEFVEHLIFQDEIDTYFIQDTLGWDQTTARDLLSFLVRQRALKREGRSYRKTSEFTQLCKEMLMNGLADNRPKYLKEEF